MITGLAREIDRIRDQQRVPYRRLARAAGLSISTVYSALSYRRDGLTAKHLDQFCQVLGIDADEMRRKYSADGKGKEYTIKPECDDNYALVEEPEDNSADIDPTVKGCRYDRILRAVRDGVSDRKIMAAWPEVTGDVLNVYHQIADKTLLNMAKRGGIYDKDQATMLERFYDVVLKTGRTCTLQDDAEENGEDEGW